MLPINKKVWITSSKKTDGRYNRGVVKGIDLFYDGLGYISETQYLKDFEEWRYKIAYVDVFTKRACQEWIHYKELSVTKPEDAV
jgi:hypothetical protein